MRAQILLLGLGITVGAAPLVFAQQSIGRGWPVGDGADWVGPRGPFYDIDGATAENGAAVGGGFNIALACDFIIASETAVFSQIFTRIALVPHVGGP